jgi:hypothetical protein
MNASWAADEKIRLTEIETITGQQDRTERALPVDRLVDFIRRFGRSP